MNMRTSVVVLTLCSGIAALGLRSVVLTDSTDKTPAPPAIVIPAPQPETPQYKKALKTYLRDIEKIKKAKKERRDKDMAGVPARRAARDKYIADHEEELLKKLRDEAAALHGKVGFDDDCVGPKAFSATSPASARLFAQLLKEDKVDAADIATSLNSGAYRMDKAWIPILQQVLTAAQKDSFVWKCCIRDLYYAGVSRAEYRATIEQWPEGVEMLLFDYDKATGDLVPVRSPENAKLLGKLSARDPSVSARVACAEYAARTGDRKLALDICTQILWTPYKVQGSEVDDDPDDRALYFAKLNALTVLFYEVGGDEAFRQVYEHADLPRIANRDRNSLPEGFRHPSMHPSTSLEVEYAQGLIAEVGVDLGI